MSDTPETPARSHRWRFFRAGGFDQVRLESAAERAKIKEEVLHQTSNWENLCAYCHDDEHSRGALGEYYRGGRR